MYNDSQSDLNFAKMLTLNDIQAISGFHQKETGNLNLTPDIFCYEYIDNPNKYSNFFYLKDQFGEVIATAGAMSTDLLQSCSVKHTFMLERSLVHHGYRGKSVYAKLEKNILETMHRSTTMAFAWSLAPQNVVKSFVKIGYERSDSLKEIVAVPSLSVILRTSGAIKSYKEKKQHFLKLIKLWIKLKLNFLFTKQYLVVKDGFTDDITDFMYVMSFKYPKICFMHYIKNKADWLVEKNHFVRRYFLRFYHENKLIGFTVLRNTGRALRIDDLLIIDNNHLQAIISKILQETQQYHLEATRFIFNGANFLLHDIGRHILKMGFYEADNSTSIIFKAIHGTQHALEDIYLTGIWAPPYWGSIPTSRESKS